MNTTNSENQKSLIELITDKWVQKTEEVSRLQNKINELQNKLNQKQRFLLN